jgi:hypothetical protein
MATIPDRPKIYHITHIKNLPKIVHAGKVWSDAKRIALGLACEVVGMSEIKRRRLEDLEVTCHPGTMVGEYVPFYFCPRSIMLYILHRANHVDLNYRGGQKPIIHLQADLFDVVRHAGHVDVRWAFTNINAGTRYNIGFFKTLDKLDKVNWPAVAATDWNSSLIKDGKQAEFLLFESFPWSLVEGVGVYDDAIKERAVTAIARAAHKPIVRVKRKWYY